MIFAVCIERKKKSEENENEVSPKQYKEIKEDEKKTIVGITINI